MTTDELDAIQRDRWALQDQYEQHPTLELLGRLDELTALINDYLDEHPEFVLKARPPVNGSKYVCQGADGYSNWAPVCFHCGAPAA
jgi:hypothetical protein